ncbi:MAG: hypothetical protein H6708_08755 [Kofleriaceae bacterium]|nr:hypothetical protein [Myxococcales bacterium]MCB9560487.1 hypothetical protein [Kofleriaceae bacterium]
MTRTLGVLSVLLSCGLVLAACAQAGGDDQPIGGDDDQGDVCGDGACTGAESPTTCSRDCGNVQTVCGDGQCNGAESAATCPRDCGGSQAVCGDGTCNGTETASSCPGDCSDAAICGDGQCNGTETQSSCPGDCGAAPICGDGQCNGTETQSSCPGDCGGGGGGATCGDFVCDVAGGECASCFLDCFLETACGGGGGGTCDHDVCTAGGALDWSCGSCESAVCDYDDWCCTSEWDSFCVDEVATQCGQTCP